MPADRVERKLVAILAADVAGYSRLMGADEEGTLARLKAHRRELIDPKLAEHRGRVVKTTGDGIMIEFSSVVDAVRCAVEVQKGMADRNAAVPDDKRIEFRVGINVGDIIIDGDDIHGDGVNIAARLESISEQGGVCISEDAHRQVQGKVGTEFTDGGEQVLKNIAKAVRVYRARLDGSREARPTLALPDKPSIAVLPFQNMSGDPEQDYFADGMSEDLTTALSKLRWFFVIARNSTFGYKGKSPDIRQVARELGVRYVLEGSVRKAGNRLRITAQLIDGTGGKHVWAEKYDREVADIFAVQDEITQSVVATIEPQLYAAEKLRIESTPPESLDAWGCVVRALWHLGRFSKEDTEHARDFLRRATALVPGYAKAHSLLTFAELMLVIWGTAMDAAVPVAEHHARVALGIDDDDPWTHFSVGFINTMKSRYETAISAFNRAIELNPNFAAAYGFMAGPLAWAGKADAALESAARAMRMSPQDPFTSLFSHLAATAHFVKGQYAEGVECELRALRARPDITSALRMLAACHIGLGQNKEARAAISEALRLNPGSSIKHDAYGYAAFARESDQQRYVTALRKAGLPEG